VKLALIPPNSLASFLAKTDYHLILPPQVKEIPTFVQPLQGYRILDNGAAEGQTISMNRLEILVAGTEGLSFHEVVAPDKLTDCDASIYGAKGMVTFKQRFPHIQIMAVVQGKTLQEVMKSWAAYMYMDWIDVIGVPRTLCIQFGRDSRLNLIHHLTTPGNNYGYEVKPVHCLGAYYQFPEECRELASTGLVRGMDSSLPFVLGLNGLTFDDVPQTLSRPDNYFAAQATGQQLELINDNVTRYIKWSQASPGGV
jgi:hypothetical protein